MKITPVILLTQLSDPTDVIRGLECEADSFITKPYDDEHLLLKIKDVLLNREIQKDNTSDRYIEICFAGNKYFITAQRRQILNLLLSIYEFSVRKNDELITMQEKLESANERLKVSNEIFANIVEKTMDGIVVLGHDGMVKYCNKSAQLLLNRTEEEFLKAPFGFPVVPEV